MTYTDSARAEPAAHSDAEEDADEHALIQPIVPDPVVAVDTCVDIDGAELFPEEQEHVARAVDTRRREFTTARWCARRALSRLGYPPAPITSGERGEPRWPEGVVGSITHCAGYRGATVARAAHVTTIGIDAEPNETLPQGVLSTISLPAERDWIGELLAKQPEVHWDRLLFCAKEAVYKAWYPLMERWLGFEEALITVDPDQGTFNAELQVQGPLVHGRHLTGFTGNWLARDGLILTAIVVPATVREYGHP